MAITNHERVGNALDLLRAGLGPFVEREIKAAMKDGTNVPALQSLASDPLIKDKPITEWDAALLLKVMWESWNEVFRKTLGPAERGIVGEIEPSDFGGGAVRGDNRFEGECLRGLRQP